jgi:hypothetical protein
MSVCTEFIETVQAYRRRHGGSPRLVVMAPDVHDEIVRAETAALAEAVKRGDPIFELAAAAFDRAKYPHLPELIVSPHAPPGTWQFASGEP